ncbi:MAG: hypothetical protein COT14_03660 [Candidatus Diapherotrites archaeon CG08_land_8_20_14_0_20_30_16]|nr:MAG: hypothetical protein COT14_03660 [Candidatus Diapherotrites archaeon CG08_land_8_20_14_0_20_30_16]
MVFDATLLGISSSTPLKNRNHTSLAVKYDGEVILFDAGESVQQQLMKVKISYMAITKIFITHFHADHFLGLPGLLATMSLHKREEPLTIYGPNGVEKRVRTILEFFEIQTVYDLKFVELHNGIICDTKEYQIIARGVKHLLPNFAFVFKEKDSVGKFLKEKALALGIPEGPLYSQLKDGKAILWKGRKISPDEVMDYKTIKRGKSLAYVVDCFDANYEDFLENVDVLFHESAFMKKDLLQAKKTRHSVTINVAEIAKNAKVKKLVLINFSPRYDDLNTLLHEVQSIYPDAELGQELKTYNLHIKQ